MPSRKRVDAIRRDEIILLRQQIDQLAQRLAAFYQPQPQYDSDHESEDAPSFDEETYERSPIYDESDEEICDGSPIYDESGEDDDGFYFGDSNPKKPSTREENDLFSKSAFLPIVENTHETYMPMVFEVVEENCQSLLELQDSLDKETLVDISLMGYQHDIDFVIEYGSAGLVTTMVDTYSFGILLMEMFTRKSPTNEMFSGELTMRRWVSESFPNYIMQIIDAELLKKEDEKTVSLTYLKSLTLIIGLALECTADVPEERLDMKVVLKMLKVIKAELTKGRGHN
ncbi:hypothetical protein RD792_011428 [Penstemon davidsonii]|uniref:Uncharacterized protein n=1 Tax=Penstemon davidsonii TaxID=160366 RepID=A0ABR0D5N5_9LAMI|nr:hypothetical protein RD792_011428 [Penstemon davidsonii]